MKIIKKLTPGKILLICGIILYTLVLVPSEKMNWIKTKIVQAGEGFFAYDPITDFYDDAVIVVQDVDDPTDDLTYGTTKYGTIAQLKELWDEWDELPALSTGYILQGVASEATPTNTLKMRSIEFFELIPTNLVDSTGDTYELELYEMKNTMLTSYGITANSVWSMTNDPTAAYGINFMLMPAHADDADTMTLTPYTGEAFYLNGVQMAANESIVNADPDIGEYLICFGVQTGAGSFDILCYSPFSDWAEETPP